MSCIDVYYERLTGLMAEVKRDEADNIKRAAGLLAETIVNGGLVHVYGIGGHGAIAAEEMFYRTGGLVPVNPLLDPGTSFTHGAVRAGLIDKLTGYAKAVLEYYGVSEGDSVIVVNNAGVSPVTIEAAREAKRMGAKVVAVTSKAHSRWVPQASPGRHPSKINLCDLPEVDVVIDNHAPVSDAVVELKGLDTPVGGTSTHLALFILTALTSCVAAELLARGITPPVWAAPGVPGGPDRNARYVDDYFERIKHL